jgi:hypothetical protein
MYAIAIRAVLLLLSGVILCTLVPPNAIGKENEGRSELTNERRGLIDFVQFFSNRIERAASQISRRTGDMRIKRNTVYFKLRVIPLARRSLELADVQAATMDLWLYSEMVVRFVDSPEGRHYFGEDAPIMGAAGAQLESNARGLAKGMLSPQQFEAASSGIAEFLEGRDVTWSIMGEETTQADWTRVVMSSLDKPLDVVSASIGAITFSSGLSDTALAVHRAADEAERASSVVGYLPTDVRWQTELLLLDVTEYLDVVSLIESATKIGDSSVTIAETAKTLPHDVRVEMTALLDEVDARRATLESTLSEVNSVLISADQTARTLTETFGALDAAMVTILGPPVPPDEHRPGASPSPDDGTPFDINDYTETAVKVSEAAAALQALLVELGNMDGALAGRTLIDRTQAVLQGIVTQIYVGAGLLVLFTLTVLLAYKAALSRMRMEREP